MKKAKLTTHEEMEADKIRNDMAMTPKERLLLALRYMKTAIALSPNHALPQNEDGIKWIDLKPKNAKS